MSGDVAEVFGFRLFRQFPIFVAVGTKEALL
jgi:hypothetical protein